MAKKTQETLGWDTIESTGLFEGPGTITDETEFGFDASYDNGNSMVFILVIDPDTPTEDGEPVRQFYSLGKGWDSEDGGETAYNPSNPSGFNKTSNYGMLIDSMKQTDAFDVIKERGLPDKASVWHGLRFDFKRQPVKRTIRGEERTSEVLLIDDYLGEGGDEEKPAKKAKAKPAAKAASGDKALRAKIKKLGKDHDDHDDFLAAVLEEFPEVEEYDELYAEVLDEDSGLFG